MPTQDPAPDLRDEPEALRDQPEAWPVVSSVDLHRDHWVVALRGDDVTLPTGGEAFRRIVLEHPGSVMVLGVIGSMRSDLSRRQTSEGSRKPSCTRPTAVWNAGRRLPTDTATDMMRRVGTRAT